MKTYILKLSFFFGATFFTFAQNADVEYRVTKEYNEKEILSAMTPSKRKTKGSYQTIASISMKKI